MDLKTNITEQQTEIYDCFNFLKGSGKLTKSVLRKRLNDSIPILMKLAKQYQEDKDTAKALWFASQCLVTFKRIHLNGDFKLNIEDDENNKDDLIEAKGC